MASKTLRTHCMLLETRKKPYLLVVLRLLRIKVLHVETLQANKQFKTIVTCALHACVDGKHADIYSPAAAAGADQESTTCRCLRCRVCSAVRDDTVGRCDRLKCSRAGRHSRLSGVAMSIRCGGRFRTILAST